MPSYAEVMQRLGANAGGTVGAVGGAAGGGFLGNLLGALDYPRQSLYGLGRAVSRGVSGDGSWDDVIGALPGALGAGLAGGLMATGVGAPLGILAGAGLGGLAQGIGKATDASTGRSRFQAPEVSDLAESLGLDKGNAWTNFGLGALTDPLTYAGGASGRVVGAAKGAELGAAYAPRAERIVAGMSPYSRDTSKLVKLLESSLSSPTEQRRMESVINDLLRNKPDIAQHVAGEIPDEALSMKNPVLGAGVSAIGIRRPEGGVTRIALGEGSSRGARAALEPPRLNVPEIVQPARSVSFGDAVRAEHLPYVNTFEDIGEADMAKKALLQAMQGRGLNPKDLHYGNFGLDPQGAPKILDPGRISGTPEALAQYAGKETARQPGTALERWFLKLFDPHGVSNELAEKLARPNPWGEIPNQGTTGSFNPLASTNPKPQLAAALEGIGAGAQPGPGTLERLMRGGEGGGASPFSQPMRPDQFERTTPEIVEAIWRVMNDKNSLSGVIGRNVETGPSAWLWQAMRGADRHQLARVARLIGAEPANRSHEELFKSIQDIINRAHGFPTREPTASDLERLMRGGEGGGGSSPLGSSSPYRISPETAMRLDKMSGRWDDLTKRVFDGTITEAEKAERTQIAAELERHAKADPTGELFEAAKAQAKGRGASSPLSPLNPHEREEAEAISGIHGMKEGESMFGSPLIDPNDWVATRMKTMDATELQRGIVRMSKMKNLDREDVEYLNMMRNELHRRGIA